MRRSGWVVLVLVAVNVAIFGLQSIVTPEHQAALIRVFGLSTSGLEAGGWWQFLTHGFLHGNLWHLLINMLSLWFAGRIVEQDFGSFRFLLLYLLGILGGGILQMLIGSPGTLLIGASGAVFAVLLAFTTIYSDQEILALIFFVIPLRIKARYLAWVLVGFTTLAIVFGFEPWIGHAAHLGGAITGYLFARVLGYGRPTFLENLGRKILKKARA
ncbi:MAG: rhomboid family intramembrane serine protease [Terrimicrobiaceae bacterium]